MKNPPTNIKTAWSWNQITKEPKIQSNHSINEF